MHECDRGSYSVVGTVDYIAPEMLAPGSEHGFAVDWWALGNLAHEMLAGRTVYFSRTHDEAEIERMIVNNPVVLDAALQPDVAATLARLLDKNPRARMGSARGAEEIKQSKMFAGFDWAACAAQTLTAPWIPALKSPLDVSHFDATFTRLSVDYPHPPTLPGGGDCGADALWSNFPTLANASYI